MAQQSGKIKVVLGAGGVRAVLQFATVLLTSPLDWRQIP
jgi:hypothetical protein